MRKKIKIIRGSSFEREIFFQNEDETFQNLEGYKFLFTVKRPSEVNKDDSFAIIKKDIVANGISAMLILTSEDTNIEPGDYNYDLKVITPDGKEEYLLYGDFEIQPSVTRRE